MYKRQDWAAALLDEKQLSDDGILDSQVVKRTWDAHQAGRGNHEHQLWAVLMFQSWWKLNRRSIEA